MIWVFSRKSHVLNNKAKAMQNLIQSNLSFKEFYIKHFPCIKPLKNFKFSLMILQWNLILQNSPLSNILWESKYTFIPKRANLCKRTIKWYLYFLTFSQKSDKIHRSELQISHHLSSNHCFSIKAVTEM